MAEGDDYVQSHWVPDYDFTQTKNSYAKAAGRSYEEAKETGKTLKDILPKKITTKARKVVVVWNDGTGSVGMRISVIVSKAPYLAVEAGEYLGSDHTFALGVVGDANSGYLDDSRKEEYPLGISLCKGREELRKAADLMVYEGEGGGQMHENYDLALLYSLYNIDAPNCDGLIIIFSGDELPYDVISPETAKRAAFVNLPETITTAEVVKRLRVKGASIYFAGMPYGEGGSLRSSESRQVIAGWKRLLGKDRVAPMADPDRIVDVIFGILAQESGKVGYFYEELKGRQTPEQVKSVTAALRNIHKSHFEQNPDANASASPEEEEDRWL